MDMNILDIRNLTVTFMTERGPLKAVNDVSFSIRPGDVVGLVGESGSGKSTIALAILNLLSKGGRVVEGKIAFKGQFLLSLNEERFEKIRGDRIAMVFQDPLTSLNPSITIGEQIAEMFVYHQGLSFNEGWLRGIELLKRVEIPNPRERMKDYPHQFSGGMQQRVLIATALSCNPDLLILDEPTTALDVTIEAQILDLLKELKKSFHSSMLFITHDLGVVARICNRVVVLYAGTVMETGTVEDIFSRPIHPYTRGLLNSLPKIYTDGKKHELQPIPGNFPDLVSFPKGCIFASRCMDAESGCMAGETPLLEFSQGHWCRCRKVSTSNAYLKITPSPLVEETLSEEAPLLRVEDLHVEFQDRRPLRNLRIGFDLKKGISLDYKASKTYAVNGISFHLHKGETFGLVGESGCGKSTVVRCLINLLHPTSGHVFYEGRDIYTLPQNEFRKYLRNVQMIFQNPDSSLNPRKKIVDIIGRPLRLFDLCPAKEIEQKVISLLHMVKLPESYKDRFPHELSGGEKQRVGIARALAVNPHCILCDEPVTALDVSVQASIINLLMELQKKLNVSYLFIAHDLSVVRHISRRIGVMYGGKLCEVGATEEIFLPPYHPYTQALLSAVPIPDMMLARREHIRLGEIPRDMAVYALKGCIFRSRCHLKIGRICEEEQPPIKEVKKGHIIYCHHTLDDLSRIENPLLGKSVHPKG